MKRLPVLLVALLGCRNGGTVDVRDCPATLDDDIATVVHVSYTVTGDGEGDVDIVYTADDDEPMTTPVRTVAAGETDETLLLGLPPLADVAYQVRVDGEARCEGTIETDNLDSNVPDVDVDGEATFRWLVGTFWSTNGASYVVALDARGRVVWYRQMSEELSAIQARPAGPAGAGIVHNQFDPHRQVDYGAIHRVGLDGTEIEVIDTPLAHHVFDVLPDGTLVYMALDVRTWFDPDMGQEVDVVGDAIVEVAPDGTSRTVFSTWDHLPVTKSPYWDIPFYPQGYDWTHGNSIFYDATNDTYLFSMHNIRAVVEFERESGAPVRLFSGTTSSLAVDFPTVTVEEGRAFSGQHDVVRNADGELQLFATEEGSGASGGVRYEITDTGLRQTWELGFDQGMTSLFLGQVLPRDDGTTLLNYASAGVIQQWNAAGDEAIWEIRTSAGTFFGNTYPVDDLYEMLDPRNAAE